MGVSIQQFLPDLPAPGFFFKGGNREVLPGFLTECLKSRESLLLLRIRTEIFVARIVPVLDVRVDLSCPHVSIVALRCEKLQVAAKLSGGWKEDDESP